MNDPNNEIVWNGLAARFGQNFVMKNGKYKEVFTSYTLIVISNKLPSIGKHTDDGIPIPYGDYVVDSNKFSICKLLPAANQFRDHRNRWSNWRLLSHRRSDQQDDQPKER